MTAQVEPNQEEARCQEYRKLRSLSAAGAIVTRQPPQADAALQELGLAQIETPSTNSDEQLLDVAQKEHAGAFLCLRCRVSWPLEQKVRALHRQFAKTYGVELIELAAFALDDIGRPLPYSSESTTLVSTAVVPFTVEVVRSFRPGLSSLSHWARRSLEGRNDLKAYLKQQGVLLIGDWALLADSSHRRVREAMEQCGSGLTPQAAEALHRLYLPLYKRAKLNHRKRTGRQRGWLPDEAFLRELDPDGSPRQTQQDLEAIAAAVRVVETGRWQQAESELLGLRSLEELSGRDQEQSLAADQLEDQPALSGTDLLMNLENTGLDYVRGMFGVLPEGDERWAYWQAWSEGLTTRGIAERCGSNPARVSRRLNTEERATEIAHELLRRLRQSARVRDDARLGALFRSPSEQGLAVKRLMNHVLQPEQEGGEAPLRRWVTQSLLERRGAAINGQDEDHP